MVEESRVLIDSPEGAYRDEVMHDLSNDSDKGTVRDGHDDVFLDSKDKKSRDSRKHKSKDRKKEHGSKDRGRSNEREDSRKDSDKYDTRERDRERRKEDKLEYDEDREYDRSRHRDKEKSREKVREKERDRGKDHDKYTDLDRERERERGGDHARDNGRERENERDTHRERGYTRDYEHGKEREKVTEHGRHRDREREKGEDSDKGHDRSRDHEKDNDKEIERDKLKDKSRQRGRDRERDRERDRDKAKDKEREKEKSKDRETDRDKDKAERVRNKEKNKESGRYRETDYDKSRSKDKERDLGKGAEEDAKISGDAEGIKVVGGTAKEAEGKGVNHERPDTRDHNGKAAGLQSTSELEERLTRMKQERVKRKADDTSEISSWVSKSRRIDEQRNVEKEKAAFRSKVLDEQDTIDEDSDEEAASRNSAKDLAGVKILHGLDKVIEGGAVVLTLKDQNILADGDINEEVDMLENVEIGEQRRRDEAYKAAKKKSLYEEKYDDMGAPRTILPQYDDPAVEEGVTLDEGGRFTGEAERKLEELRKRIQGGSTQRTFEDLTTAGKVTSDYFTPDEMLQFKKPKKKKSLRKREKLDLDALEAEAVSAGFGAGDLGSRKDPKRRAAKEEEAKNEAEARSNAYQSALAKAEEASKVLRQDHIAKTMDDDDLVFGEDYEDLEKSLEQARKLALKRKEEDAVSGPQAVALLATAKKELEGTENVMLGEPQENKVVITEMEEFVLGLQLNEETHKPESEDVFNDEDDVPKPIEHEMEVEVGGWTELKETNNDEQLISEEKKDITPDEIIHEVAVGKGLSGALKLLKDRGTLKESIDWGGRNMDKKKSKLVGINDNDGPKEIRIERTDEFGRIMTPKEAFRMISHKFHGKGPGKMKQEKRMKQYQEDLKTKQMKASDTPLLAMERMREAQAQLKSPYIVLSGHVKPGQTSDPRSGFATVEKDHPGSLTPMLGDKKVEHFLGISRKTDMGPPPPKKHKG